MDFFIKKIKKFKNKICKSKRKLPAIKFLRIKKNNNFCRRQLGNFNAKMLMIKLPTYHHTQHVNNFNKYFLEVSLDEGRRF
jgi:hypothetical protein